MNNLKKFADIFIEKTGYRLIRKSSIEKMSEVAEDSYAFKERMRFLMETSSSPTSRNLLEAIINSKSQLSQDILVIEKNSFKRGGYFVEIGVGDGVFLSNTHLLEKHFGWTGILAEPCKKFYNSIIENRTANFTNKIIAHKSGDLIKFNEHKVGELSGTNEIGTKDIIDEYMVTSLSLLDLLKNFEAPNYIDYLSIDTEGSEYSILEGFNFNEFSFGIISVEHNFSQSRSSIQSLLKSKGYIRIYSGLSKFDDFYINQEKYD